LAAEPVEEGLHDVGPDDRQGQAEGGVAFRANGAEEVGGPIVQGMGRWSLTPVGRLPFWYQRRQLRPVRPIRASSCSQPSMRPEWQAAAAAWAVAVSAVRLRNFL